MRKNLSEKARLQRGEIRIREYYRSRNLESAAKRDYSMRMLCKTFIFLFAMSILSLLWIFLAHDVTTDLDFECSSGDIDTDITAHYNTQGYPCNISTAQPGTCFRQTLLKDSIEFKGIDGLTCRGRVSVKAPVWLMMGAIFP